MTLRQWDMDDLIVAKTLLENQGIAMRISDFLGTPIEMGFELLPDNWNARIVDITQAALSKAVRASVFTMKEAPNEEASNLMHKIAAAASGGIGGFFGLPALAVELPLSVTIMLRSIVDIARSEGEIITQIPSQLACIEVFAFGGGRGVDPAESGYFATRAALARSVTEASEYLAATGAAQKTAPAFVRLIAKVAERFGIQVSEKAAAQAIPAIGAAGGGIVNTIFMDHFQNTARGHFIVRRLERTYEKEIVKQAYDALTIDPN